MTTTLPDVPVPPGALEASSCEECSGTDGNSRTVGTPMRCVAGREDATVWGAVARNRTGSRVLVALTWARQRISLTQFTAKARPLR